MIYFRYYHRRYSVILTLRRGRCELVNHKKMCFLRSGGFYFRFLILALALAALSSAGATPIAVYYHGVYRNQAVNEAIRRRVSGAVVDFIRDIHQLASVRELADALRQENFSHAIQVMQRYTANHPHEVSYAITGPVNGIRAPHLSHGGTLLSHTANEDIIRLSQGEVVVALTFSPLFDDTQNTFAYLATNISSEGQVVGHLFLGLSHSYFESMFEAPALYDIVVVLDTEVVYSTVPNQIAWALAEQDQNVDMPSMIERYGVLSGQIFGDIYIYTLINTAITRSAGHMVVLICAVTCGIILIAFLCLSWRERKRESCFNNQLNTLVHASRRMDLSFRLETDNTDVFHPLYDAINSVMDCAQKMMEQNKELAERRSQIEIQHLLGQFNPHFVFNVMANLQYMIVADTKKATEMISRFSRLLRYSIQGGDTDVSLKTDIKHLSDYLNIQKIRFNEKLNYSISIPDALQNFPVSKLLLQPLVENAIKHNWDKTDCLHIQISAALLGGDIIFQVADNGPGIPPQDLDHLQKKLKHTDASSEHIGLLNVHRALQIRYGPQYGLELYSVYKSGTTVTVRLPAEGCVIS